MSENANLAYQLLATLFEEYNGCIPRLSFERSHWTQDSKRGTFRILASGLYIRDNLCKSIELSLLSLPIFSFGAIFDAFCYNFATVPVGPFGPFFGLFASSCSSVTDDVDYNGLAGDDS